MPLELQLLSSSSICSPRSGQTKMNQSKRHKNPVLPLPTPRQCWVWRPGSFSSWTLPRDTAGKGGGFLMKHGKLLLPPSSSKRDMDIEVHLTRNRINTIDIYTYMHALGKSVKDVRGTQSIQL